MAEIQETKQVWVAWTNTDCTEGRGYQYPKAVCAKESTAVRLGRKGSVQGSDCNRTEQIAVKVNNNWLIPGRIEQSTTSDDIYQKKIDAKRAAVEKATAAGLTEEEIQLIANLNHTG